jgi:hypothetical protein
MFVVAVTLGLLAAMGVYGMSATALDVRAAGHTREAAQAQHAAEGAIIMAAQALGPGTAGEIVRAMQADYVPGAPGIARSDQCKSAKPYSGAALDAAASRAAESCIIMSPSEMKVIAPNTNWLNLVTGQNIPFTGKSFGDVPLKPYIRVELTNPIDWEVPAGYQVGVGRAPVYTQVRATVYTQLQQNLTTPAEFIATGRGRLVVGPYTP